MTPRGPSYDDFVRTYGTQAYHAATRLMRALHEAGGERREVIHIGHVAVHLARAYYDQEPDLGPSPTGGPALTIEEQLERASHAIAS